MKMRRTYDKAFKLEVVQRSLGEETVKSLSEELGIHINLITKWRKQFLDAGELSFPGNGRSSLTEEEKRIQALEKELAEARLETEILKKAITIFSKKDRRNTSL